VLARHLEKRGSAGGRLASAPAYAEQLPRIADRWQVVLSKALVERLGCGPIAILTPTGTGCAAER